MFIYTTVPEMYLRGYEEPPQTEYLNKDGIIFECLKSDNGYEISRIISTDPADYIKEEYAPGKLLNIDGAKKDMKG